MPIQEYQCTARGSSKSCFGAPPQCKQPEPSCPVCKTSEVRRLFLEQEKDCSISGVSHLCSRQQAKLAQPNHRQLHREPPMRHDPHNGRFGNRQNLRMRLLTKSLMRSPAQPAGY